MASMKTGVYVIECQPANRVYVGSSLRCGQRMADHRSHLRKGEHHNHELQRDYDQYGAEAFTFQVVKLCSVAELPQWETYYIGHYASVYNIQRIGSRPGGETERVDAARERQIERMRATLTGRKWTPEHRANFQRSIEAAKARGFVKRK